jgi:uncharacterized damage-inducible protein DinB
MSDFQNDRSQLLDELAASRASLLSVVASIAAEHMETARRGSWTVKRILDHVLLSERLYTQLVGAISGQASSVSNALPYDDGVGAATALDASRKAFLDAVDRVAEDDFYRLQTIGHEEYSVLSILENNSAHDHEHSEQLRKTLSHG